MKKSLAVLSTEERSMGSGGRLSQCRRLGKFLRWNPIENRSIQVLVDKKLVAE